MRKILFPIIFICFHLFYGQDSINPYHIRILDINTELADFGTAFFGENQVVFAAPRQHSLIAGIWPGNKQPYLDMYMGKIREDGEIYKKKRIKGNANTRFHEAGVCFSKDGKTAYFTGNNFYRNKVGKDSLGTINLQLFRADVTKKGVWTNIVKLPFNSDQFSTGHPALSPDEKQLYFVSDRPGSLGMTDIYVVDILNDGLYSPPLNVGSTVNTEEAEMFPYVDEGGVLFFSSKGHNAMGGLDIFASTINETRYGKPINVEALNSQADDFAMVVRNERWGYFSSNRSTGKGDDDIYFFKFPKKLLFDCKKVLSGVVYSNKGELIRDASVVLRDGRGNKIAEVPTDSINASYNFKLSCEKDYSVLANRQGYESDSTYVSFTSEKDNSSIIRNLTLNKSKAFDPKEIMIKPIYFAFDRYDIEADAALELEKLVHILNKFDHLTVMATSHTDSRGSKEYNLALSQRRMLSVLEYLASKGIDLKRVRSNFYGETDLTNNCKDGIYCKESEHLLNRRTEFTLIDQ